MIDSEMQKQTVKSENAQKDEGVTLLTVFIIALASCIALWALILALSRLDAGLELFFGKFADFLADYRNVAANIVDFDPYREFLPFFPANNPAMSYLIILPFALIARNDFLAYGARDWTYNNFFLRALSLLLFFAVAFTVITVLTFKHLKASKKQKILFLILLLFSYPFLFLIERGNALLYCLMFLMIYFCYYKSEKKRVREFAIVSLAIAINIKFYCAVFVILLFKEYKFLPCVRLVLYSAFWFVAPFLCFKGGLSNISRFMGYFQRSLNEHHLTGPYGFLVGNHSLDAFLYNAGITKSYTAGWISVVKYCILIFGAFFCICLKNRSESLILAACLAVVFPILSFSYILVIFLLPLLVFLNSEKLSKRNIPLLVFLIFIFSPLQYGVINRDSVGVGVDSVLKSFFILVMVFYLMWAGAKDFYALIKNKQLKGICTGYLSGIRLELSEAKSALTKTFKAKK